MTTEIDYDLLSLAFTPKLGPVTILKLLKHFGSAKSTFSQSLDALAQIIKPEIANLIRSRSGDKVANISIAWQQQNNKLRHLITLNSSSYPEALKQIYAPAIALFAYGNIELLANKKIAIVGTRHPTAQGINNAFNFARDLSYNGFTIVSGLASGIDKHAHLGASMHKASTIGVIGTGIDLVYPKSNLDVYQQIIASNGLILSEYPLQTQALASNFPRRNRIISGLSLGCLVIESTIDGGSLISANYASEMGREVMAIPGSINNPMSRGCHKLIKNGAKLIENVNDVLEEFAIIGGAKPNLQSSVLKELDPILNAMGYDPISIDQLCVAANLDFNQICTKLLEFELSDKIINCGNGYYQRIFK